jgi:hypothetical protein
MRLYKDRTLLLNNLFLMKEVDPPLLITEMKMEKINLIIPDKV